MSKETYMCPWIFHDFKTVAESIAAFLRMPIVLRLLHGGVPIALVFARCACFWLYQLCFWYRPLEHSLRIPGFRVSPSRECRCFWSHKANCKNKILTQRPHPRQAEIENMAKEDSTIVLGRFPTHLLWVIGALVFLWIFFFLGYSLMQLSVLSP